MSTTPPPSEFDPDEVKYLERRKEEAQRPFTYKQRVIIVVTIIMTPLCLGAWILWWWLGSK
jgi:uncharacterized ion transporter superfamily protein YfcC